MKKMIVLLCGIFIWCCCPICTSDCFYTVEKSIDVVALEKYRDINYDITGSTFEFVDDTLQEKFYGMFRLYIDSINVYKISMPVSVEAFVERDGYSEKIDSSLIKHLTANRGRICIFINRKIQEAKNRLKIVVAKDGKQTFFEFDITQKAYKSSHSRRWMSFISF